jgi:hypothetical protein
MREKPYITVHLEKGGKSNKRLYRPAEMIAKFYKYVNILQNEETKDSADKMLFFKKNVKFEPFDFTHDNDHKLGLMNNARLGDEHLIMFNEKELQTKVTHVSG